MPEAEAHLSARSAWGFPVVAASPMLAANAPFISLGLRSRQRREGNGLNAVALVSGFRGGPPSPSGVVGTPGLDSAFVGRKGKVRRWAPTSTIGPD